MPVGVAVINTTSPKLGVLSDSATDKDGATGHVGIIHSEPFQLPTGEPFMLIALSSILQCTPCFEPTSVAPEDWRTLMFSVSPDGIVVISTPFNSMVASSHGGEVTCHAVPSQDPEGEPSRLTVNESESPLATVPTVVPFSWTVASAQGGIGVATIF